MCCLNSSWFNILWKTQFLRSQRAWGHKEYFNFFLWKARLRECELRPVFSVRVEWHSLFVTNVLFSNPDFRVPYSAFLCWPLPLSSPLLPTRTACDGRVFYIALSKVGATHHTYLLKTGSVAWATEEMHFSFSLSYISLSTCGCDYCILALYVAELFMADHHGLQVSILPL